MTVLILEFLIYLVWTIYSIRVVFSVIISLFYKIKRATHNTKVKLVVVTIANERVKGALFETLSKLKNFKLETYVVTDEGAPLIPLLKKIDWVNLVIVPRSYKCKAKAKARAINYFIQHYVEDEDWYMFLDDDSYPLDKNFLYEVSYYKKRGYVAGNCILVPRMGKSKVCYILDHFRTLDDLTFFRMFLGVLNIPVLGFHGEGLIVKGKVLKEIGYDFDSLVEDFRFGQELLKRGYKVFQSSTRISIKSPNSIWDLMKQRARWIRGLWEEFPRSHWLYKGFSIFHLWKGLISFFGSAPFLILSIFVIKIPMFITFPFGFIYFIFGMFIMPKKASLIDRLKAWLVSPIEPLAHWYALFSKRKYYVIDKN